MKTLLSLCAALTLSVALSGQPTHYWVDAVNGSDTNSGTRTMPSGGAGSQAVKNTAHPRHNIHFFDNISFSIKKGHPATGSG